MDAVDERTAGLDQRQLDVVRREYSGPARLGGPAGTGKTVVALHRLAWLAGRTTGRLLYVGNLPQAQAAAFRRLAPESAHRVEFTTSVGWARDLLLRRGLEANPDPATVDEAFARAWVRAGGALATVVADPGHWRDEVDHVIKGGGVTTAEEYLRLPRGGRRPLDRGLRERVWELYGDYQALLSEAGVQDDNDALLAAVASLRQAPLKPPYAAVVADDAHDLNLAELRLLREVAGDGPNGLLLVDDCQQAVYPGGGRFADAGIGLRGRGDVLRVNYRNASAVLAVAQALPGAPAAARAGGIARHYVASCEEDHDIELVTALRTCAVPPAGIAVLTRSRERAAHYRRVLYAAQIPAVGLAECAGRRVEAVKVGTIRRAKGLEFHAVFLPGHTPHGRARHPDDARYPDDARHPDDLAAREAYVAVTRAREYVWTGSVVDTGPLGLHRPPRR